MNIMKIYKQKMSVYTLYINKEMKSLSLKNSSLKKMSFHFSDCFDPKATIGSILYSRCLLYIVLFVSLINLFYIINMQDTYSLIIFFLVGFITSFFIKNMIIIILFATFVSLFFHSSLYIYEGISEGFEGESEGVNKEGYKYSYQGEVSDNSNDDSESNIDDTSDGNLNDTSINKSEVNTNGNLKDKSIDKSDFNTNGKSMDKSNNKQNEKSNDNSNDNSDKASAKLKKNLVNKNIAPTATNVSQLKNDMKAYFDVQEQLLDVLEKAEPLQKEAMAIKERFAKKTNTL